MLSAFLAFFATLFSVYMSSFLIDISKEPVYIASMGAAAVLLFAVPNSPFSQPWAFLGSHLIASVVAVFCYQNINFFPIAIATAVALSIFFMYVFRCLHPPGGGGLQH